MSPYVREYQKKDYRLVRIGLSAEAVDLLENRNHFENNVDVSGKIRPETKRGIGNRIRRLTEKFFRGRVRIKREDEILQKRHLLLQKIQEYWGDELTTYCICSPPVTYFNAWRFSEFRELIWMERLLYGAELPHYLVLGYCSILRDLLFIYARKMKSLKICVTGQEYKADMENLIEELYSEFGLMVTVQILGEGETYRRLEKLMPVSCNVLDFTGERRFSRHIVPSGSIWYDMDADEEKRIALTELTDNITYKSLTVP